jgi:thiamine biosynthesis lipoprotein
LFLVLSDRQLATLACHPFLTHDLPDTARRMIRRAQPDDVDDGHRRLVDPNPPAMRRLLNSTIDRATRTMRWRRAARRAQRFVFNYEHVLGTSLELQVMADVERGARQAEAEVLAEVDRLASILSGWSPSSELARWLMTDTAVPVSPDLANVLEASQTGREHTGGAFDPAAQAIIDALRGGAVGHADTTRLDGRRGPHWLVNRADGTARRLTRCAISLDAIAKGYIVTRAAARAHAGDGVRSVLLNIGGDLQHFGATPVAVGIADPAAPAENAPPIAVVQIRHAALATSGGYRRGFVTNGRRVSHIVDPRTGRPADRTASASVFAPDCATADALSTAFSVMEPHHSVRLADALPGVGCLIVDHDGVATTNAVWNAAVPGRGTT